MILYEYEKDFCFVSIFFILLTHGCASIQLKEIQRETLTDTKSVTGNFTVILYGGRHDNQLETLAVLDREDDKYEFEPYAPEFNYIIQKHLAGEEALKMARSFLGYKSIKLREIKNNQGEILGYELRRHSWHLRYGTSDVLDVNYVLKKDQVFIYIMIKPSVEKILQGN